MRKPNMMCKVDMEWLGVKGSTLKVVGLTNNGSGIMSCSLCDKDEELFPAGSITTYYAHRTTCGCASTTRWGNDQYLVLINRKCAEKGFLFHSTIPISGSITGRTKLVLEDIISGGIWETTDVLHLLHSTQGCPSTGRDNANKVRRKAEEALIEDFNKTGSFKEGTKFKRDLNTKSSRGRYTHFFLYCPLCAEDEYAKVGLSDGWFRAAISRLKKGSIPCRCSIKYRWTEDERLYQIKRGCIARGFTFYNLDYDKGSFSSFTGLCDYNHNIKMTINGFINNKSGCRVCSEDAMGFYPQYTNREDTLYLLDFGDFIKIGRSFNFDRRLSQLETEVGILPEVINLEYLSHINSYNVEQRIIKENVDKRYYPSVSFAGMTECFHKKEVEYILNEVKYYVSETNKENSNNANKILPFY